MPSIERVFDKRNELKICTGCGACQNICPCNAIEMCSDVIEGYQPVVKKSKCINCGKCYNVCPVYINPKNINDKCIKCGLCSYYCPSNISLLEKKGSDEHV